MAASYVEQGDAVRILHSGGILLMATDTLPGFHCRADRAAAVERIDRLKGREEGQPLLVLAGSAAQASEVVGVLDSRQSALCAVCWPGPFSLILPANKNLAAGVSAGRGTVAVRVPGWRSLQELVLAAGFPLVSTSANLSGEEPAADLAGAVDRFGSLVDGILDLGDREPWRGPEQAWSGPSTLVDATVWPPLVLRAGPRPLPAVDQGS